METIFSWSYVVFSLQVQNAPAAVSLTREDLKDASIHFQDVHFHYESKKDILRGLSFSVQAGKSIALVGGSGSGYNDYAI